MSASWSGDTHGRPRPTIAALSFAVLRRLAARRHKHTREGRHRP